MNLVSEALDAFHPLVREWFARRFDRPTEAQAVGWPAIASGRHALIAAPTGSGKTLAAFLVCLDRLIRQALDGALPQTTQVVYVSPLKALSNDIQKNLLAPLEEIAALAAERGRPLPPIRVEVRTGDTQAAQRRKQAKTPPHILITTPESLYVLLTSRSGRAGLSAARTLIVDEIHAVAGNKRGSHLALTMERLERLVGGDLERIGLSATQNPIDEVARFLVGSRSVGADGRPDCAIVDSGRARPLDLAIWHPDQELSAIATHEIWAEAVDEIARLAGWQQPPEVGRGTVLVFVNTRRLAERVAYQLTQRLGADQVVTHHGSLSREIRLGAEDRLKRGDVRVCVATASLELGLDIGHIDLVCQIGSARALSVFLQRAGRSNHAVGGVPRALVFPLTRDELLEVAATLRGVASGELDRLWIPPWPLDVLAQQIVACAASEDWVIEDLWSLVLGAYPYRDLPRDRFDQVLEILCEGVAGRTGRMHALLHRDAVNGEVRGRRAALLYAVTNGGAIPDNADYDVVLADSGVRVGTINEDFAIESMAGDVFQLGNTSWQVMRVESGRVRVVDAQGAPPTIPFWLGEAPARTLELSSSVSDLREELARRLSDPGQAVAHAVAACGISRQAAEAIVAYLEEGKRVLGVVPTKRCIAVERFFDEAGGMQLVIHAPLGGRINRAWGMALRKRFCRSFDFELQAAATDDGVTLSLGPQHSFPLEDILHFLNSRTVRDVLVQAILQAPLFRVRWRHAATRALAILRFDRGVKVPPALQRMRADDLLAQVFPAQVGCQDNRSEDIEPPDHPLVFETLRDCTDEALDLEGLIGVLEDLEAGEIVAVARDTPQPSVFAHALLNAAPYAFLDDAPLEERRARAVLLRRALPESASDLSELDPGAIAAAAQDAWPLIRDADELHDALLTLGLLPLGVPAIPAPADSELQALTDRGRAASIELPGGRALVAAERLPLVQAVFGDLGVGAAVLAPLPEREGAVDALVRGWLECSGPLTVGDLQDRTLLSASEVEQALARLEAVGVHLRGRFTPGRDELEVCDRRILARIHRATVNRLRREIEPVAVEVYLRFLFEWQHATPSSRLKGSEGLLAAIDQMAGYEAAALAWEQDLLPLRVADYAPTMLDRLALGGEVVWGRFSRNSARLAPARSGLGPAQVRSLAMTGDGLEGAEPESTGRRAGMTRAVPISLGFRGDLPWLLAPGDPDESGLSSVARAVLAQLERRGASFAGELQSAVGILGPELEDALGQLVAAGRVTSDGFSALRHLMPSTPERQAAQSRWVRHRRFRAAAGGRWALLSAEATASEDEILAERAAQLVRRYGVLCREVVAREPLAVSWRQLLTVLRRAEARGEIRGGRFIEGLVGEQFALPEAVESLRAHRKAAPGDESVRLAATDPLNLSGILTAGPRLAALPGQYVIFRGGTFEPAEAGTSGPGRRPDLRFPVRLG